MASVREPREWLELLPHKLEQVLVGGDVSREDIARACEFAADEKLYGVVVNPTHVRYTADRLAGTTARVITVVGFPTGAHTKAVKTFEARDALRRGAQELEVVINVAALTHGYHDFVRDEIKEVVAAAEGTPVKTIIECGVLSRDQKTAAAELSAAGGAYMVKTSTGFAAAGATEEDVRTLKKALGDEVGVEAAGGIRSYERAINLIAAGADRVGTSSAVVIMAGLRYAVKAGRLGAAVMVK